jgi:hypothetical protein
MADLLIAVLAMEPDCPVYTLDEHFQRVPGLRLHQVGEEPLDMEKLMAALGLPNNAYAFGVELRHSESTPGGKRISHLRETFRSAQGDREGSVDSASKTMLTEESS